jgi:septum formation protein
MTPPTTVVLASASPARRALLRAAGVAAEVRVSRVTETALEVALGPISPAALALALARAKAKDVAAAIEPTEFPGPVIVIGADTLLDFDGVAHGRPTDDAAAAQRWREFRGRSGILLTGHAVRRCDTGQEVAEVASTVVHFGSPTDAEIAAYVATGEPTSVAGGFTIDGFGAAFIACIEGDAANVTGLSLPLLRRLLAQVGIAWTSLWPGSTADRPSRWP